MVRLCHQYMPGCTSVKFDQALYCWLTNFKFSFRYPLNDTGYYSFHIGINLHILHSLFKYICERENIPIFFDHIYAGQIEEIDLWANRCYNSYILSIKGDRYKNQSRALSNLFFFVTILHNKKIPTSMQRCGYGLTFSCLVLNFAQYYLIVLTHSAFSFYTMMVCQDRGLGMRMLIYVSYIIFRSTFSKFVLQSFHTYTNGLSHLEVKGDNANISFYIFIHLLLPFLVSVFQIIF